MVPKNILISKAANGFIVFSIDKADTESVICTTPADVAIIVEGLLTDGSPELVNSLL